MNILITGAASGLGNALCNELTNSVGLTRTELDLSDIQQVLTYQMPAVDILINCAGTDIDGKTIFDNHNPNSIVDIMNTNLIAPMLLSQKALVNNMNCKIVNITSTNNNRYYQNNLAYSLSKLSLSNFGNMLRVEYPSVNYLEVRLGLTATQFNKNRYRNNQDNFQDIYNTNKHLLPNEVAKQIVDIIYNNNIKFIEISS